MCKLNLFSTRTWWCSGSKLAVLLNFNLQNATKCPTHNLYVAVVLERELTFVNSVYKVRYWVFDAFLSIGFTIFKNEHFGNRMSQWITRIKKLKSERNKINQMNQWTKNQLIKSIKYLLSYLNPYIVGFVRQKRLLTQSIKSGDHFYRYFVT